jgi:hypothetical protein
VLEEFVVGAFVSGVPFLFFGLSLDSLLHGLDLALVVGGIW